MRFPQWRLAFGVKVPTGPAVALPPHRDAAVARARRLTALADILGFDYVFHGGDALSTESTLALLGAAKRLRVVAPVSVTAWHPALLARFGAVAARISAGRFAIDLRSGPHPNDRRAEEFARIVRGLWSGTQVDVQGEHFQAHGLRPRVRPGVAPEIVVSGSWKAAPTLAARVGDWYLSSFAGVAETPGRVAGLAGEAASAGREVGFALAASVSFDPDTDADLRGDPDEIAGRLVEYGRSGVRLAVLEFADPEADLPVFARRVAPLVNAVGVPAWS
jgi:FMNH2-dependent dimethyl sulfone monooxygenase